MNLNLLLNFDRLDGFMTPEVSGKSTNAKQINLMENRKTLANELNIEVFEEFFSHGENSYMQEHFADMSPRTTPKGQPLFYRDLSSKCSENSPNKRI